MVLIYLFIKPFLFLFFHSYTMELHVEYIHNHLSGGILLTTIILLHSNKEIYRNPYTRFQTIEKVLAGIHHKLQKTYINQVSITLQQSCICMQRKMGRIQCTYTTTTDFIVVIQLMHSLLSKPHTRRDAAIML